MFFLLPCNQVSTFSGLPIHDCAQGIKPIFCPHISREKESNALTHKTNNDAYNLNLTTIVTSDKPNVIFSSPSYLLAKNPNQRKCILPCCSAQLYPTTIM